MRIPPLHINYAQLREKSLKPIGELNEIRHRLKLRNLLSNATQNTTQERKRSSCELTSELCMGYTKSNIRTIIDGGLLSYLLHCEARIASSLGQGFYTMYG
jgi:hypothetical protein